MSNSVQRHTRTPRQGQNRRGQDYQSYLLPREGTTPQSLEAEQSTLGAMMMEADAIKTAVNMLAEDDFYRQLHRKIFRVIVDLWMRELPVDLITVVEELRLKGLLDEVGGAGYLTALIESCPSSANVESYIRPIVATSQERQALQAFEQGTSMIYRGDGVTAIEVVQAQLNHLRDRISFAQVPDTITAADLLKEKLAEPGWAVPGFVPQGFSVLGGKMKQGKSWMALALAIAVASGGHFLGHAPAVKGPVLYLALEDSLIRLQQRTQKLLAGAPAPADLHLQNEWPTANEGGLERIERWIQQHTTARLVIIDVLQKFRPPRKSGGDLYGEDYAVGGALKRLGDKYGVAILVLHHLSKRDSDDPFEALSGTVGIPGAADGLMVLDRKRGKDDAVLHITGRDIGQEKYAIRWDGEICNWSLLGDAEEVGEENTQSQILQLLSERSDAFSPRDVAEELGLNPTTVRVTLRRLANEGRLNVSNHQYKLVPNYGANIGGNRKITDYKNGIARSAPDD